MKRKAIVSILLVMVMAMSLVLSGCGGKRVFDESGDITVSTEYEVYGGNIDTIGCVIENNTDKTITCSHVYEVEKLEGEEWENIATYGLELSSVRELEGGKKMGFVIQTDSLGELSDGKYRVVKPIGEKYYAAEFEIGKSEINGETPFGVASFDGVPADYTADEAVSDGCVVLGDKENLDAVAVFADKAAIGLPALLRIADYSSGELSLTDIIFDGESFTHKTETSEQKYPFMFTDEEAVYLSDCVSNGYLSSFPDAVKVPVLTSEQADLSEIVPAVKEQTRATIAGDSTVYMCYSPKGDRYIRVLLENSIVKVHTDILKYIVGTPDGVKEYGSDDADGIANQITRAEWLDDTTVIISFKTVYGINYFETRDTAKDEVIRHSYSDAYKIENGEVTYIG